MTFQPFGPRFDIRSPLSPESVKTVVRARKKGWLDAANGARGWVIGPFICLWWSAFDQYGPMLIGRISHDGMGTRITGRAGSDLNGVAWMLFLAALMVFCLFKMIEEGQDTRSIPIFAGVFALSIPLTLWMAHKDRSQAEPLVLFLHKAATSK